MGGLLKGKLGQVKFFFFKENWCCKIWALGLLTNGSGKGLFMLLVAIWLV